MDVEDVCGEGRVDVFFLCETLGEGADVPGVGHVGVDVELCVAVEGEFGRAVDAVAGVCYEEDGLRGFPC